MTKPDYKKINDQTVKNLKKELKQIGALNESPKKSKQQSKKGK